MRRSRRFQRLAGRPVHLGLTFTGPALAGLDGWLADALELQVDATEIDLSPLKEPMEPTLNLLEGSRAGVLKMGNQPFEFSGGRFLPMKGVQSDMAPKKSASSFLVISPIGMGVSFSFLSSFCMNTSNTSRQMN